jgi:hypothetical protein
VAREGSPAPDTPNGINFGSDANIFGFDSFRYLMLNGVGQIAFWVPLIGSRVDSTKQNGNRSNRVLQLVIREGELFEVPSGDFRVVSGLSFAIGTENSDGRPSGFNNSGHLAFRALFTDGSQEIFDSNRVALSEPSSLLFIAERLADSAFQNSSSRRFSTLIYSAGKSSVFWE